MYRVRLHRRTSKLAPRTQRVEALLAVACLFALIVLTIRSF